MEDIPARLMGGLIMVVWGGWVIFRRNLQFTFGGNSDYNRDGRRIRIRGTAARIAGLGLIIGGMGVVVENFIEMPGLLYMTGGTGIALIVVGLLMGAISSLTRR